MKQISGENGGRLLIHETQVDSVPIALCVDEKETDSEQLLNEFADRIPSLWSGLYSIMESGFADYGHSEEFPPPEFFLSIGRMTPDDYMGDKSDFHLRFEFEVEKFSDKLPMYDFFLDGDSKIVHHQPVF